MPGPAVYLIAALAFVGTAIIVKEFVYEPHIAPLIEEYREERRRRRHGPVSVPQQPHSTDTSDDESQPSNRGRFGGNTHYESDSDSEHYGRPHSRPRTNRGVDIELEDLVAREIREWGSPDTRSTASASNTHGLRLRRNPVQEGRNALDEDNQHIPFATITPRAISRGHSPVSSPSTASTRSLSSLGQAAEGMRDLVSERQANTPSPTRTAPILSPTLSANVPTPSESSASILFTHSGFDSPPRTSGSPRGSSPPSPRRFSPAEVAKDLPPLPAPTHPTLRPLAIPIRQRSSTSDEGFADSVASSATSARTVRPPSSFPSHLEERSTPNGLNATRPLLPRLPSTSSESTLDNLSSPIAQRTTLSPTVSPVASPSSQVVPSLSQSYPQELDYEHNVVLLSPPSSRSESPFSVLGHGESVGSPFVGFAALGESPSNARNSGSNISTPVSSAPHSPSGSVASQYLSLPGSNAPSAPGSPTPARGQSVEPGSNPFIDPQTPRTPTSALDLDSELSDWEHAGIVSSPSPPRPAPGAASSPGRASAGFGSDDDDDVFSDSGLSEASLSSWASVSGSSSNGA